MIRHTPRKRFGQNFLVDRNHVERIVRAIDPQHSDRVVEIGPGLGALTVPLLARVDHLDVVEIDRELVGRLRSEHPPERLTVHEGDALDFDFAALGKRLRIVGNLPYNISSPLLFHLAGFADRLVDLHVMLQKEVVQRMVAAPGTPEYGRLSVMLQVRFRIARLFIVPPGAFRPVPKVDSAVVRLTPLAPAERPAIIDPALFGRVVALAFGQRRKTLRNALQRCCDTAVIAAAGVDPGVRGETLSVEDFVRLANAISSTAAGATAGNDARVRRT
jgi:16S rRNA (adenine1518-N6/adenine1519-N6)-dimethyltransferase